MSVRPAEATIRPNLTTVSSSPEIPPTRWAFARMPGGCCAPPTPSLGVLCREIRLGLRRSFHLHINCALTLAVRLAALADINITQLPHGLAKVRLIFEQGLQLVGGLLQFPLR